MIFDMNLTKSATKKVSDLIKEEDFDGELKLRIFVQGGGCSGLNYGINFTEEIEDGDWTKTFNDVTVVVDEQSQIYLNGLTVNYNDDPFNPSFAFDNPSAGASCGCGTSFQPKDAVGGCA